MFTEHITEKEVACKCCGKAFIEQALIDLFEKIRACFGQPIKINSGYRCPFHNEDIGGSKASFHMEGKALDIAPFDTEYFDKLISCVENNMLDFGGIGINFHKKFIHIDIRPIKTNWYYDANGKVI